MIPAKIHYCWFGKKEIPSEMMNYIEKWKEKCPNYEIVLWNEDNFDININAFVKKAYELGKYAFVTDYARLWIIYNYGGFYLDTDVELLKSLDKLRSHNVFFGCEGTENVATGLGFGAVPKCDVIKKNMKVYEQFKIENDFGDIKPCPFYTTKILKDEGFKFPLKKVCTINDITVYPNEYFNPYDWAKEELKVKSCTYSIHHYAASWMTVQQKRGAIEQHFFEIYRKKYGERIAAIWSYLYWCKKKNGGNGILNAVIKKVLRK